MKEIDLKFESCMENDTLQEEIVSFKGENGEDFGQVTLRQLTRKEVLELSDKMPSETKKITIDEKEVNLPVSSVNIWNWTQEYVFKAIKSWTLKLNDKPLELTLDNVKGLLPQMINALFESASQMNNISEVVEKNSEGQ